MDDREAREAWARRTGDAIEIDELKAEVERLSLRQLTLYDVAGEEVFTMTIGPQRCRWTAGAEPIKGPIGRVEIDV